MDEDEEDDVSFDVNMLGELQIPVNLEGVTAAIEQMQITEPTHAFQNAQMELDRVVAGLFGMSDDDLNYITSAMVNDGFLKQLRPNLEHRGLRIQRVRHQRGIRAKGNQVRAGCR